mgnify:CR=1 FL=1
MLASTAFSSSDTMTTHENMKKCPSCRHCLRHPDEIEYFGGGRGNSYLSMISFGDAEGLAMKMEEIENNDSLPPSLVVVCTNPSCGRTSIVSYSAYVFNMQMKKGLGSSGDEPQQTSTPCNPPERLLLVSEYYVMMCVDALRMLQYPKFCR